MANSFVSTVDIEQLRKATEQLQEVNTVAGAVEDLFKIVLKVIEAGAGSLSEAGADRLPQRSGPADIVSLLPQSPPRPLFEFGRETTASPAPAVAWARADAFAPIRFGRYQGGTPQMAVDLRVDAAMAVVSADLWRVDTAGQRTWVASLRSAPGVALGGQMALFAEDRYGARSSGRLEATPAGTARSAVHCVLLLDRPLDGLPFGREIVFTCERAGDGLRELGLEFEIEQDVAAPPQINFEERPMSVENALVGAGIEVLRAGEQSRLPQAPNEGWSEKQLEELMFDFAQSDLTRREFALRVLWLSRSNRDGLLGVMFDTDNELPRQGLAVFAGAIREFYAGQPGQRDRKLIQTTVHEIGHALNLAHRFEREVARADSTSFMNYDWRYRGGGRDAEFWRLFAFTFDADELAFLRHAPYPAVVPGGAPFRSVRYWAEGNGGYSPYVPEAPLPGWELRLLPPQAGPVFAFGQPVLLGVRLTNRTGQPLRLPRTILDPKAGFLEMLIRRIDPGRAQPGAGDSFVPITTRCFDLTPGDILELPDGASHEENLNLTFGAAGFAFAEPGVYEVRALLVVTDNAGRRERVTPSDPLQIRVAYPKTDEAERVADVLFRSDVGRWFALGAPARLTKARDELMRAAGTANGTRLGRCPSGRPIRREHRPDGDVRREPRFDALDP
ncbi:MAG: acetyltransferase [Rhodospirillales bacterium]|nr:acetyltransferase [Rhodospirillales bacterium]